MSLLSQKIAGYHKIQFAFSISSSGGGGGGSSSSSSSSSSGGGGGSSSSSSSSGGGDCSSSNRKRVSGSIMVPSDMQIFIVPLCLTAILKLG